MAQTAAHLVDHVIPHVPVRQWVLLWVMRLPNPLRLLLAAQPKRVTPALQVVHRVITRHLLGQAGCRVDEADAADEADSGAVTLMQRFRSAANPNIHLHCMVLDGVYRRWIDGAPEFVEGSEPTDDALQVVLHKIVARTMKLLTRRGYSSKSRVRLTWPTTKAIRTKPARSGRCRRRPVLTASPSVLGPARRC